MNNNLTLKPSPRYNSFQISHNFMKILQIRWNFTTSENKYAEHVCTSPEIHCCDNPLSEDIIHIKVSPVVETSWKKW